MFLNWESDSQPWGLSQVEVNMPWIANSRSTLQWTKSVWSLNVWSPHFNSHCIRGKGANFLWYSGLVSDSRWVCCWVNESDPERSTMKPLTFSHIYPDRYAAGTVRRWLNIRTTQDKHNQDFFTSAMVCMCVVVVVCLFGWSWSLSRQKTLIYHHLYKVNMTNAPAGSSNLSWLLLHVQQLVSHFVYCLVQGRERTDACYGCKLYL